MSKNGKDTLYITSNNVDISKAFNKAWDGAYIYINRNGEPEVDFAIDNKIETLGKGSRAILPDVCLDAKLPIDYIDKVIKYMRRYSDCSYSIIIGEFG